MRPHTPTFDILFEDDDLIVLVKPAGLPTANAAKGADSVFTLLQKHRPQQAFLGVVSRLDAPVSGVLVMAKNRAAAADLSEQFREHSPEKVYLAVVEGRFPAPLDQWVELHDVIQRHDAEKSDGPGRPAHLRARVVRRAGEVSLVELEPTTGRRHQLRVQLSNRRCPIVGDRRYGARIPMPVGIALHAHSLILNHPANAQPIRFESPRPVLWATRFPALFRARYG